MTVLLLAIRLGIAVANISRSFVEPPVGAGSEDARLELLSVVAAAVPRNGVLEVIFAGDGGDDEQRIGYDFQNGAWYRATSRIAQGQERDGTWYFGEAGLGRTQVLTHSDEVREVAIVDFIPSIWLVMLSQHPNVIDAVTRKDDVFLATIRLPAGEGPSLQPINLEITYGGRVERAWREGAGHLRQGKIEYRSDSPAGTPLPTVVPGTDLRLVSFAVDPDANHFDRGRAEAVSAQLKLQSATLSQSASQGANKEEAPGASGVSMASSPGERWRLPLVAAGVVVVLIGAGSVVWNRRR